MKTIALVVDKYKKKQPFKKKNILICTHFKGTALHLLNAIKNLGGSVYYFPIDFSQDDKVLQEMKKLEGFNLVKDISGLKKILPKIDIIFEDGARVSKAILKLEKSPKLKRHIFSVEQTTHGFLFWGTMKRNKIPYPIVSVSHTHIKSQIENSRATPEAILNEFLKTTGSALTSKSVLILGYGMIGSGLARLLRAYGANVTIAEIYPIRRLISISHGFKTIKPDEISSLLPEQDIIISCTNSYGGSTLGINQFLLMKDGAVVFNGGSGRGEIEETMLHTKKFSVNNAGVTIRKHQDDVLCTFEKFGLNKKVRILCGAHPINLRTGKGTSQDVIDFVFSLMILAGISTDPKKMSRKAYNLDVATENEMAEIWEKKEPAKQPTHIKGKSLKLSERHYGGVVKFLLKENPLDNFSVARAIFHPGSKTFGHYHLNSEEGYIVEKGAAEMTMFHYRRPKEKKIYNLKAGDYITIPKEYFHDVKVTSKDNFEALVIASPPFSFWDQFFLEK